MIAVRPGGDVVRDLANAGLLPSAQPPRHRSRTWLLSLPVLALSCACCWLVRHELVTPQVVQDLPSEADDVEYASVDMFPDGAFYLSARLADAACRRHVEEHFADLAPLDLDAIDERERHWVDWGSPVDDRDQHVDWWVPAPMTRDNTWVHHRGDSWELVQCEGGYVHMYFFTH